MDVEKFTVLLIEDNTADARLLAAKLETAFDTVCVEQERTLAAGLDRLIREAFDIVLLDLGLPDCSGLDGCRALIAAAPNVPVVIVTGFDDEATAQEAVRAGAQDYLVKDDLTPVLLRRTMTYAVERLRASLPVPTDAEALALSGGGDPEASQWWG